MKNFDAPSHEEKKNQQIPIPNARGFLDRVRAFMLKKSHGVPEVAGESDAARDRRVVNELISYLCGYDGLVLFEANNPVFDPIEREDHVRKLHLEMNEIRERLHALGLEDVDIDTCVRTLHEQRGTLGKPFQFAEDRGRNWNE